MDMTWKKREERAEKGLFLSMALFIILVPLGLFLDIEILIVIGALMLLYLPGLVVVYCIWGIRDDFKKWKKKRRKAKRYAKIRSAKLLTCTTCEKIYDGNELDLSPSADPRCPICGKLLKIKK